MTSPAVAVTMSAPSVELSPPASDPTIATSPQLKSGSPTLTPTPPSALTSTTTASTTSHSTDLANPRKSRILPPPSEAALKRLSTASNPSREAPRPDAAQVAQSSMSTSPPSNTSRRVPQFPSAQASRLSMISLSSKRESFHPAYNSSLTYAVVRDFAYPALHPLHYGPPPVPSGAQTPAGSQRESGYMESSGSGGWYTGRRLSDPAGDSTWGSDGRRHTNHPPPLKFQDGPPWSEDDDLISPVIIAKSHHGKHKSSPHGGRGQSTSIYSAAGDEEDWETRRRSAIDSNLEPGGNYYTTGAGRRALAEGEPGGELYNHAEEGDEYNHEYYPDNTDYIYSDEEREYDVEYNNRFSKDYQFTIASPEEEMHGKAVALFDFVQENENELPLVEGQVVWISFRHGMGWLVAEDPKTGESGLVPEEYVRLLRDMTAGTFPEPSSEMNPSALVPDSVTSNSGYQPAHQSTFSTSSQDIHLFPQHLRPEAPDRAQNPAVENIEDRVEKMRREQELALLETQNTPQALEDAVFERNPARMNGDVAGPRDKKGKEGEKGEGREKQ